MADDIPATRQPLTTVPRFEDLAGHELLTPYADLSGLDQARLLAQCPTIDLLDDELILEPLSALEEGSMMRLADLIYLIQRDYAPDPAEFEAFTSGPGGLTRAARLCVCYARQVLADAHEYTARA